MSAPDEPITIEHEQTGHGGRFVYRNAGHEAELTYEQAGAENGAPRISADHTFVPDSMRGQGIAARLTDALVATARQEGWKIVPHCSYVVAAFQRHPDWNDVLAH